METPRATLADFVRLMRPAQWAKGAFVLVGPVYGHAFESTPKALAAVCAVLAFGFASSACYVFNDLRDIDEDRAHPRKAKRPIAAGRIGVGAAKAFAALLIALAAIAVVGVWLARAGATAADLLAIVVGVYVLNTTLYSLVMKHVVILDVISLSLGFVLRVMGGCAATLVAPSTWLLNVTLFLAMFLAFGKRLGERRTMGDHAPATRGVQAGYTDHFLRMAVVVTAVACLVTYAGYVQAQDEKFTLGLSFAGGFHTLSLSQLDHRRYGFGFNLLWLTMIPATYGLLRAIVMVERGAYDDPTEMAAHDRPVQLAALLFGGITLVLMAWMPAAAT